MTTQNLPQSRGTLRVRPTDPDADPHTVGAEFGSFQRDWETQIGDGFQLPTFSPTTTGDFRVRAAASRVHDIAITEIDAASELRTTGPIVGVDDQIRMWAVRRGAWILDTNDDRERRIGPGELLLQHVGRPTHFRTEPGTEVRIVVMPADLLRPLVARGMSTGSAESPEVRLLLAHTAMVREVIGDLGEPGLRAAHGTVIELVKSLAEGRFDDAEPLLAPALARSAMDLADRGLADPDLSPATLAARLHVSVRTLQRAFAGTDDSIAGYIRRRRLEEARLALSSLRPPTVTEIAAYWQFAHSSHFIRAFKRQYGRTPTEFRHSPS